mgnify:FL=1
MMESPEPVLLWIPLMKNLGMSWEEIKSTPRFELRGLMAAYNEFENLHSMDGYEDKDVSEMAKNRPSIRSGWHKYLSVQRKYNDMVSNKVQEKKSFKNLVS